MSTLATILGTGKGTWHEVHELIKLNAFDKVIIFIDEWAAKTYRNEYSAVLVPIPENTSLDQLQDIMMQHLKAATSADFDIAINIASGNGMQHTALIASALKLGVGIRLVTIENGQLKVIL